MSANGVVAILPFAIFVAGSALVALFDRAFPPDERAARALGVVVCAAALASSVLATSGDDAFDGALRRDVAVVFFVALIAMITGAALMLDASSMRGGGRPTSVVLVL